MIDSHAHLNDEQLINNIEQILIDAKLSGVSNIINVGYDMPSSVKAVELANTYENLYAVVGIHPHDAKNYSNDTEIQLSKLCKNKKVVALGEIGLDYHYNFSPKPAQTTAFIKQIKLADRLNLPVVIHTREAIGDTLKILSDNNSYIKNGLLIHCFNGSIEVLNEILKRGYYVSFGGAITFKNANGILDCVKACPLERILLETDCPYMTPVPFRGQLNTPKNIELVAQKIAELKKIPVEQIRTQTENNTKKFFKI